VCKSWAAILVSSTCSRRITLGAWAGERAVVGFLQASENNGMDGARVGPKGAGRRR